MSEKTLVRVNVAKAFFWCQGTTQPPSHRSSEGHFDQSGIHAPVLGLYLIYTVLEKNPQETEFTKASYLI